MCGEAKGGRVGPIAAYFGEALQPRAVSGERALRKERRFHGCERDQRTLVHHSVSEAKAPLCQRLLSLLLMCLSLACPSRHLDQHHVTSMSGSVPVVSRRNCFAAG